MTRKEVYEQIEVNFASLFIIICIAGLLPACFSTRASALEGDKKKQLVL
jgi:hypothetical protein